jgi:hypothetical protein
MIEPVFINWCAGSWLICSPHIDRMMQIVIGDATDVGEPLHDLLARTCRSA